ncbi:hypothetical protein G0Q06_12660 [Puniceicoccales bacterium CK1056]|uniref:Uncharacterized protein n=1 Tax=Oceanipulchritudo coccoides TaxID=2706888 RepID=A0A6B2M510_9BACT|nr:alginate lyase family protein [Oceanipulchritudo coccoides]NDV63309.1 hypothetical protein [Oceanipulchritudo coccoides]
MKGPQKPAFLGLLFLIFLFVPLLRGQVSEDFLQVHEERLEKLFSKLDTNKPGITEIFSQWNSGEQLAAASALCRYYEQKDFSLKVLDPPLIPANVIEQAEAAIERKFFLLNEWEDAPLTSSGEIDWTGRGARNDKERAWMLNRHAFLLSLAEAETRTGEERFRNAFNSLWADWIRNNPYPDRLTFSAPWRALEVARRILNSWTYCFYGYNTLDDETRLLVLSSILDHADALTEHTSFWGGNHLITEKMALLAMALAWPEFADSSRWRDEAIGTISAEFISQTYPDGSYKELSNHYQRVVLTNTIKFMKLLESADLAGQDVAVVQRIEQMWDFFAGVMRPDGFGPLNNASDTENNAAFLRAVWERFNRPDWLYMASNGQSGTEPGDVPSRLFEWAGQAILRTGWERDASWVYFDAGPYGTAHQHVDRLHVSAALNGRQLLVDNGRYIYQPGPWKDYFQGPAGHNILLLDGMPSKQAPREIRSPLEIAFEQSDTFAFAAASAQFEPAAPLAFLTGLQSSTPWTRAVLLDQQGRFVLILDHLLSFRKQEWKALWHFHPDVTQEEASSALLLVSPTKDIRKSLSAGSSEPTIAGFHSPEYNLKQPAVQMEFSGTLDGPTTLVWLLRSPHATDLQIKTLSKPADPIQHLGILQNGAKIAAIRLQIHPEPRLISLELF